MIALLGGCALSLLLAPRVELGMAARYADPPRDRYDNGRLACRRRLLARLGPAGWQRALAQGIAHRSLPCGTRVRLYDLRTSRAARGVVVDSGPYGAMLDGRWVLKRTAQAPGKWRGVADLRPGVADRLGVDGLDPVLLQVKPGCELRQGGN